MTTTPVMSITEELLKELEEAAKAATPGPWFPVSNNAFLEINTDDDKAAPSVANVCSSQFLDGGSKEAENGLHIARANPDTVLALIARVRELEKAQRWVPVSERLPEPNVKVLAHSKRCPHFFALRKNRQRLPWEFLDGDTCHEKITHWMQLPEAPK